MDCEAQSRRISRAGRGACAVVLAMRTLLAGLNVELYGSLPLHCVWQFGGFAYRSGFKDFTADFGAEKACCRLGMLCNVALKTQTALKHIPASINYAARDKELTCAGWYLSTAGSWSTISLCIVSTNIRNDALPAPSTIAAPFAGWACLAP